MPLFEYYCPDCHTIFTFLVRNVLSHTVPRCPRCDREDLSRRFSSFALNRGEERRLEAMSDPAKMSGLDENDPKSVARLMKKMAKELGEKDLGPEFQEMMDRLESGESPEAIEQSMDVSSSGPAASDSTIYEA